MSKLKRRLLLNLAANLSNQGTGVLIQLATVPLFLRFWSKERYGAWILISSIPVCLSCGGGFRHSGGERGLDGRRRRQP